MERTEIKINTPAVPCFVRDNIAECLLKGVRSFFANPDNAAKFEQWLAERQKQGAQ